MARPIKTRAQYFKEYKHVIYELVFKKKSLRTISREQKVGLSTLMRLKKRFAL